MAKVISLHERSRWKETTQAQVEVLLMYPNLPHDLIVELHWRRRAYVQMMKDINRLRTPPTSSA